MSITSVLDRVREAKGSIENLTPEQVRDELQSGNAVLIDIRDGEERQQNGTIEGAEHASRGMLEFHADPSLPYYKPVFGAGKKIILHCASGGRSALAVRALQQMGYEQVAHLDGGLKAWKEAGMPVSGTNG